MRNVDHLAVDAERAGLWTGLESRDDLERMGDLGFRRRVAAGDRRHLIRMDGQPPGNERSLRTPAIQSGFQTFDFDYERPSGRVGSVKAR